MNFDEIKYIFLILMNQLNIEEFKKFICWLDQLVKDYKECGNNFLEKYQYEKQQITCGNNCLNKNVFQINSDTNSTLSKLPFPIQKQNDIIKIVQLEDSIPKLFQNSTSTQSDINSTFNDDNDDESSSDDEIESILQMNTTNIFKSRSLDGLNLEVEADQEQEKQNSFKKETSRSIDDQNKRKIRFTAHQKYELEKLFDSKKYISRGECEELAIRLELTHVQIKDWFKNHRKQLKRTQNMQFKKSTS